MIVKTEGICGGSARIAESRLAVWLLVSTAAKYLSGNYGHHISEEEIKEALAYYGKNKAEIDKEIEENEWLGY